MIVTDLKRKGTMSEIIRRLTDLEKDMRLQQASGFVDSIHPLAELGAVENAGIEEDIKRKGIISEIISRLTKLEADMRKLKARG